MKEIETLYDSIHMPQELEHRILTSAPQSRHSFRPAAALAAALVLVVLVGCTPSVQAAVKDLVTATFPSLDLTIEYKTYEDGTQQMQVSVDTESGTFAEVRDGRLFFTGNGEEMDITDQITEETPFYYTYDQDDYEITLVVGYDGTIENFGTHEFIKQNGQWVTGTGRNYLDMETETAYPWLYSVWETMDVPWPMPGNIIVDGDA